MQTVYVAPKRRKRTQKTFVPSVMQRRLLAALTTVHFADVLQLLRFAGYADTSITKARAALKTLTDHGYVHQRPGPRETQRGSVKSLYVLAPKGVAELATAGIAVPVRFRPSELATRHPVLLDHTRQVNDTLIQLHRLCVAHPQTFTLERLTHELELRRTAPPITLPDGTTTSYAPDGFATVRLHLPEGDRRRHLVFEIDRDTMKRTGTASWQTKCMRLVAWLDGPYEQAFTAKTATIAVIATAGDAHAVRLTRWLERILRDDLGRDDIGPSIFVTGADPARLTPEALFTAPRWRRCFADTPESLLPEVGS